MLYLSGTNLFFIPSKVNKFILCFSFLISNNSYFLRWAFSDSACQLYGFLGLFFGYAIMSAITMIVVDEYLMFNSKTYTAKRLRLNQLMILFVWLSSLFWSLCPLFGWSRFSIEPYGTACTVVYFANDGYESYIIAVFLFYYLTPLIFLAYAKRKYDDYKKVDLTDEKNAAKLSVRWKPFSRNLSLSKLYFFKNGTLMLLLNFLICWTPYTLTYLWPIIFKSNINIHFSAWSPVFAKITPIFTAIIFKREEIQSKKSEEN